MKVLVQKFGGTSLSTDESRKCVVSHIEKALQAKYKLVVVVSAMGRLGDPYATDTLLQWIEQEGRSVPARERDLLLACGEIIAATTLCSLLHHNGVPATVLTGAQAGILTNEQFGSARIISVDPSAITHHLQHNTVVIVTGFQGHDGKGNVTTLGRGGSDTSATAIGAALHAQYVDIYTDVNGVLTADPSIVDEAQILHTITYDEIGNMAQHGARVIHPRAVEIAMQANIPLRIRSTFASDEGTLVTSPDRIGTVKKNRSISDRYVTAIAVVPQISQIEVHFSKSEEDLKRQLFHEMARNRISIDFINVTLSGVVYTVFDRDAAKVLRLLDDMGLTPQQHTAHCAKVAVIGGGMNGVPGIMANIVEALAVEDVTILQSADSNTTIWVLVREHDANRAVRALHTKFALHELDI